MRDVLDQRAQADGTVGIGSAPVSGRRGVRTQKAHHCNALNLSNYQLTGPLVHPSMQGADAEALQSAIRPPSVFHVPLHLAQAQLSLQMRLVQDSRLQPVLQPAAQSNDSADEAA